MMKGSEMNVSANGEARLFRGADCFARWMVSFSRNCCSARWWTWRM